MTDKKELHLYMVEDGWIEVFPGDVFHFGHPMPGEIKVESIAHALARLCRYNGHTTRHYSVAEHACHVSDWVRVQPGSTIRDAYTALHHDDAEYIIGDLPKPIKVTMPNFMALERILDMAISLDLGTTYPFPPIIKEADSRILKDERHAVMVPSEHDWGVDVLEKLGVKFWSTMGRFPWYVERQYLKRHHRLLAEIRAASALAAGRLD
ncbi:MAG: hypothetical protein V3S55_15275 [Nitrospiraceae bacterium]